MAQTSGGQHAHKLSVAGLIVTLGIIYGDIGTSPLYVFKTIVHNKIITEQLVYGAISCVFWTLTLQTTFKYVLLTLRADNRGEGGIFSLFALIRRYVKWIYIPAIFGAALLLAEGMITPPLSVSSAIEALKDVKGLETVFVPGNNLTVGIVFAIISLLFFFQRFGTKIVGFAFGPIMLVWFSMIFILGLIPVLGNIAILKSLNPYYAYDLLANYPQGFWLLGAVFLCTTGAEALYSDLGHCGRINIQVSWIFVKIALIFSYMGQGVWLMQHMGQTIGEMNPFYELMPHWFLLIGIGIASALIGTYFLAGEKIRKIDFNYYLINSVGLVLGYLLVYLGTEIFGGRDDLLFFNIVSITFGLSLGANFSSALKYETTFLSWTIYNVVQLIKAFLQLNIANIAKYIFYMINAAITLGDWIWNRDVRKKAALS